MLIDCYDQGLKDYNATEIFVEVSKPTEYLNCPKCDLKPLIWEYSNGRHSACGCGNNNYDHFSVQAESICSITNRSENGKDATEYDSNELRNNWNHWCKNRELLFESSIEKW